jgi:hypothetical protein
MPSSKLKFQALHDQVQVLLEKNVIETVQNPNTPGYYSRFFVVPKKQKGKWRSILDLSLLSNYIVKEKFKMETPELIRTFLQKGNWATSLDLMDAYYHVLIHPSDRKFLRFKVGTQVFQFRALPMGLSSSPRIFTRVIKCIKEFVQKRTVHLYQYLDDWLVQASGQAQARQHTRYIVQLAHALGWKVNVEKSELVPSQKVNYLGY